MYRDMFMPDSIEETMAIEIHLMSFEAAHARLVDIYKNINRLINDLIPTFIPIVGQASYIPALGGGTRKAVIETMFSRINLPPGDWLALKTILPPEGAAALLTLARAIDELWSRWEREEQEVRRLASDAGVRSPDLALPERSIGSEELTCIRQAASVLAAALAEAGEIPPEGDEAIPLEYRTRPMSITEAADLMGYTGKKVAKRKRLSRLIADKGILFIKKNRETYIFNIRDFPLQSQDKIRAT
jgi:hypothetical protein